MPANQCGRNTATFVSRICQSNQSYGCCRRQAVLRPQAAMGSPFADCRLTISKPGLKACQQATSNATQLGDPTTQAGVPYGLPYGLPIVPVVLGDSGKAPWKLKRKLFRRPLYSRLLRLPLPCLAFPRLPFLFSWQHARSAPRTAAQETVSECQRRFGRGRRR